MKQKLLNPLKLRATLLVAMMCALFTGQAWADTAGFSLASTTTVPLAANANPKTTTITGTASETWNVVITGTWTSSSMQGSSGSKYWQMGANGKAISSAVFSTSDITGTITSIVVNCASYQGKAKVNCTVGGSNFGTQNQSTASWSNNTGNNLTFSGSGSGEIRVTIDNSASGARAVYIQSITVTYTSSGGSQACATPTFSPAAGTYTSAQNVTLSTETTGATIYYTTDGNDPTTSSSVYSTAIPVSSTTTIKAMAVKSDYNNSSVASATYTIQSPSTIAAVRVQGTGSVFTQGIVTSCSGTTAYIQDATAAICVYGAAMTVGDEVTVQGSLTTYKGLLEISSPTINVLSSGNSVTPIVKTISEINTDYSGSNTLQGMLVTIEDATVTAISSQNVTISQGGNTIVVRFNDASDIDFTTNDVITLTGNIGCYNAAQIVHPTDVSVAVNTTPVINADDVELAYDATSGTVEYTITNPVENVILSASSSTDWISNITVTGSAVTFTTTANEGNTDREGTITLSYTGASDKVVTVTQAHFVVDYATLDFYWNDTTTPTGITNSGVGTYSSSPYQKFDSTGDYLVLKINETPGTLTFDIKGNPGSGPWAGTFKVQTSANGIDYSDLETYTSLSSSIQSQEFNLDPSVRYIKWVYTEKNSGNVGLGNIVVLKPSATTPSITAETSITASAAGKDGTITVTYNNITEVDADIVFCDEEGEDAEYDHDWLTVEIDSDNNIAYSIDENESTDSRTAYFRIHALDDENQDVFSDVITVTQSGFVVDYAELPFLFDGGYQEAPMGLTLKNGMTQDYATSPKLKFKTDGDYVILKINERPGVLLFDVKSYLGENGWEGTLTVEVSADGENYQEVASYSDISMAQVETKVLFKAFNEDVRYIKWTYTKVHSNVGLGNIQLYPYPVEFNTVNFDIADEHITVTAVDLEGTAIADGGRVPAHMPVALTTHPVGGYKLSTITATDEDDNNVELTRNRKTHQWMFSMPEKDVTISATAEPQTGMLQYFALVTSTDELEDGDYLIAYKDGELAFNGSAENLPGGSGGDNYIYVDVTAEDKIEATTEAQAAVFTINAISDGYSLLAKGQNKYIGWDNNDSNGLADSDSEQVNTISFDEDGNVNIISSSGNYMRFNAGSPAFRYFKAGTYTSQQAIQLYKLVEVEVVDEVTIKEKNKSQGYTTYVTQHDVSFAGLTAYIATTVHENTITLQEITSAPVGTAVVVKGDEVDEDKTYSLNVITTQPDDVSANLLKGSDGTIEGDGSTIFALGIGKTGDFEGLVGFYPVKSGSKVPAGRAYIKVNGSSGSKAFLAFNFGEDNTTAIEVVRNENTLANDGVIYNLAGQRVEKAVKGVYIVNGKKIIVK